jgi:hypothetical protein
MADVALRPQPFLAHWAPGAIVTGVALYYFTDSNGVRLFWRLKSELDTTLLLFFLALVSFALGQVLDAFRDGIVEDLLDRFGARLPANRRLAKFLEWFGVAELNWSVFVTGEKDKVERLEVWFYSHYMLTFNLGVGLLILPLHVWRIFGVKVSTFPPHMTWAFLLSGALLLYDAMRLRSFMGKLMGLCAVPD